MNTPHILVVDDEKEITDLIEIYLTQEGYYGNYILEHYQSDEIEELSQYIQDQRNELLNYSGLDMLYKRYLIQDHDHHVLETPQEMFMGKE